MPEKDWFRHWWPHGDKMWYMATFLMNNQFWFYVLMLAHCALVAPRFGPDQGISWQFFLASYLNEKHWKIFFCTLVCAILCHLAFTVAPLSTFLWGILRGRWIVCGPEFLVSEQNLVIFQQPVIVSCYDMALHDIYGTTLPWYHTTMVPCYHGTTLPYGTIELLRFSRILTL